MYYHDIIFSFKPRCYEGIIKECLNIYNVFPTNGIFYLWILYYIIILKFNTLPNSKRYLINYTKLFNYLSECSI